MTLNEKELIKAIADYIADNGTEALGEVIVKASRIAYTANTEEEYGSRKEIIDNLISDLKQYD